jgi:hypothetical protein
MFHFATSSLEREVLGGVEGWEEGLESKFLASALDVAPGRIMAKQSREEKVNEADVLWRFITTSPWCGPGTRSRLMGSSLPWVIMRLVCIRWGRRGGRLQGLRTRHIRHPPRRRGSEVEVGDGVERVWGRELGGVIVA